MNKKVGDYLFTGELKKGRRSTVYLAQSLSDPNRLFVVKNYSKRSGEIPEADLRAQLGNEMKIMDSIKHPNVTKFVEFNETANNFYLILPYYPGGNMEDYLKTVGCLPEATALYFLRQMLAGLIELASHHVFIKEFSLRCAHVEGDHVAIGSFGRLYRKLSRSITTPPEYFFGSALSFAKEKGCAWSLGIAFYKMLFGQHPFNLEQCGGKKTSDLLAFVKGLSGFNLRFPEGVKVTEACKQLLRAMIQIDPAMRIGLQDCLADPVFLGLEVQALPPLQLEKPWLDSHITQEESPQNGSEPMQLEPQHQ